MWNPIDISSKGTCIIIVESAVVSYKSGTPLNLNSASCKSSPSRQSTPWDTDITEIGHINKWAI